MGNGIEISDVLLSGNYCTQSKLPKLLHDFPAKVSLVVTFFLLKYWENEYEKFNKIIFPRLLDRKIYIPK